MGRETNTSGHRPFSQRADGEEETVPAGAQRYVLKGEGEVEYSSFGGGLAEESTKVGPGSLVEVDEQCNLRWSSEEGFVVLTPGFEDWTEYFSAVAIAILLFGFAFANFVH